MIRGKRVILRLIRDVDEVREYNNAYNDLSERSELDHTEIRHANSLMSRYQDNGWWGDKHGVMIITTLDDRMLGSIFFHQESEFELEIGYRLFKRNDRGKGYGSEAIPLFCAWLFESKPILRLSLRTAGDNIASQRVAEKTGFVKEGVQRKAYFYRGKQTDFVLYGMLREECPSLADLLGKDN